MAQQSLLELVAAFETGRLSKSEFEAALERQMQFCQRRQEELSRVRVLPEDQAAWDKDLWPGLDACYEGLIGAAAEALAYAHSQNPELLVGIAGLLQEVEHISAYLAVRAGAVSAATRQILKEGLAVPADGLALDSVAHGKAESQIAFLEES